MSPPVVIGAMIMDMMGRPKDGYAIQEGASVPGKVVQAPGGVARNVAQTLAALLATSCRPLLISAVGRDPAGIRRCDDLSTPLIAATFHASGDLAHCVADVQAVRALPVLRHLAYCSPNEIELLAIAKALETSMPQRPLAATQGQAGPWAKLGLQEGAALRAAAEALLHAGVKCVGSVASADNVSGLGKVDKAAGLARGEISGRELGMALQLLEEGGVTPDWVLGFKEDILQAPVVLLDGRIHTGASSALDGRGDNAYSCGDH
eukprot:gene1951-2634_t